MYNLGICYKDGKGFEKPDLDEMFRWIRKTTILGHVESREFRGHSYETGKSVIGKDPVIAEEWYRKRSQWREAMCDVVINRWMTNDVSADDEYGM
ncbi:hypothetical protein BC938DRAFT_479400 [Jimgerdemannia flammicorona]|uniref:Uncharacterized protein n=1 Tax=Jimgerdemannia flammicorona TaxID=994334 RepID=A0A433QKY3_9FUNG|nr:hypothetical protein BC938DRAFT_479400 [Jimgerdemannia flammicorona]